MKNKIYGIIIIMLCVISITANNKESDEMTIYIWKYASKWKYTGVGGTLGIRVSPPKNSFLEIYLMQGQISVGAVKNWTLQLVLEGTTNIYRIIYNQEELVLLYPNSDYLGQFKLPNPQPLLVFEGDILEFFITNAETNYKILIDIRGFVNVPMPPTITTMTTTHSVLEEEYTNIISGELER